MAYGTYALEQTRKRSSGSSEGQGFSLREFGKIIDRFPYTLIRELTRNSNPFGEFPHRAQEKARRRLNTSHRWPRRLVHDTTPRQTVAAFLALRRQFRSRSVEARPSITDGNGSENILHASLNQAFSKHSDFRDPNSAWRNGSVENTNRLIRRFLPKRTNFDIVPEGKIKSIEAWLNTRPRRGLDFQTPAEASQALRCV